MGWCVEVDSLGSQVSPYEEQILHIDSSHLAKRRCGRKSRARVDGFIYPSSSGGSTGNVTARLIII